MIHKDYLAHKGWAPEKAAKKKDGDVPEPTLAPDGEKNLVHLTSNDIQSIIEKKKETMPAEVFTLDFVRTYLFPDDTYEVDYDEVERIYNEVMEDDESQLNEYLASKPELVDALQLFNIRYPNPEWSNVADDDDVRDYADQSFKQIDQSDAKKVDKFRDDAFELFDVIGFVPILPSIGDEFSDRWYHAVDKYLPDGEITKIISLGYKSKDARTVEKAWVETSEKDPDAAFDDQSTFDDDDYDFSDHDDQSIFDDDESLSIPEPLVGLLNRFDIDMPTFDKLPRDEQWSYLLDALSKYYIHVGRALSQGIQPNRRTEDRFLADIARKRSDRSILKGIMDFINDIGGTNEHIKIFDNQTKNVDDIKLGPDPKTDS